MKLPDETLWDETACSSAICQHPQCWATIRRVERGHPRMLGSLPRTALDTEDKLPVLTIANLSTSSLRPKRLAQHPSSGCTFPKAHSLLSRRSKFDSKFQDLEAVQNQPANRGMVSVLNLDKTWLPCTQDARPMTVSWIPPRPEKARRSRAEKEPANTSKGRREKSRQAAEPVDGKRGASRECCWGPLVLLSSQDRTSKLPPGSLGTQSITEEVLVPPPSPAHLLDQLSSTSLLSWPHVDTLPFELIKDLLAGDSKTLLSAQMRLELAKMKKSGPLEKSRPTSALSSKMFLSIHHLTLQRPALRYPERLKKPWKARCSESAKSPVTRKGPLEKAEESNPLAGDSTLPAPESHTQRRQQQLERAGPTLKQFQDATEGPALEHPEHALDFSPKDTSTKFIKAEADEEGIPAQEKAEPESLASNQEKTTRHLSARTPKIAWNLELKLLRLLQDTEEEEGQESPPSPAQRHSLSEQDG
ncbi:uncharacterized protein C9orf43 homolog [Echinops telfairi]|uniref:Uncharacterized protein C9orf43 homolog n=1 Tax=Echinops telfairi TaxID=9371 RepID=A0AC55DL62_ECHTE|nr:uncharacterized protein C9orf43 homolog [Echinops telfairi]